MAMFFSTHVSEFSSGNHIPMRAKSVCISLAFLTTVYNFYKVGAAKQVDTKPSTMAARMNEVLKATILNDGRRMKGLGVESEWM